MKPDLLALAVNLKKYTMEIPKTCVCFEKKFHFLLMRKHNKTGQGGRAYYTHSLEAYAILDTYVVATYVDNREQCTTEALSTVAVLLMSSGAVATKKKVTDG